MALNIKDSKTDELARQLAAATGEPITLAVRKALEERLNRLEKLESRGRSLIDQLREIGKRCAALRDVDKRSAEDILGYDEHGLPR